MGLPASAADSVPITVTLGVEKCLLALFGKPAPIDRGMPRFDGALSLYPGLPQQSISPRVSALFLISQSPRETIVGLKVSWVINSAPNDSICYVCITNAVSASLVKTVASTLKIISTELGVQARRCAQSTPKRTVLSLSQKGFYLAGTLRREVTSRRRDEGVAFIGLSSLDRTWLWTVR